MTDMVRWSTSTSVQLQAHLALGGPAEPESSRGGGPYSPGAGASTEGVTAGTRCRATQRGPGCCRSCRWT